MQMVAWAQMLRDYSQDRSVAVAVMQTFDGEHPCALCKKISAGKEEESQQKQDQKLPGTKTEPSQPSKWLGLTHLSGLPEPRWAAGGSALQGDASTPHFYHWDATPPVPPPRLAV